MPSFTSAVTELQERGLSSKGRKAELQKRLADDKKGQKKKATPKTKATPKKITPKTKATPKKSTSKKAPASKTAASKRKAAEPDGKQAKRKKSAKAEPEAEPEVEPEVECVPLHVEDVEWLPVPFDLFTGAHPHPRDVRQGCLNNCYFICALEIIAEHRPDAIEKCITQIEEEGIIKYKVRLFTKYGHERVYIIDNLFWCDTGSLYHTAEEPWLMYASSPTRALWPAVLEKAWALHCSALQGYDPSYENIEGSPSSSISVSSE